MKEIGILYSTRMILAKLAGRKTVTRRTRGLNIINQEPRYMGMEIGYRSIINNRETGKNVRYEQGNKSSDKNSFKGG